MPLMNYEKQMKNAGHVFRIEALHIKDINGNPDFVELFPYIEGYTENYDSSWNEEDVFGRMDGISNFVSVKRSISISLKVAAGSLEQARENQYKISKLIKFLYPSITPSAKADGTSFFFRGAPILRLKLGNIIADVATNGGLYGYMQGGVTITPSHKDGWFAPQRSITVKNKDKTTTTSVENEDRADNEKSGQAEKAVTLFFKYFDISFTFKVLHNHPLGTNANGPNEESFTYFPYGLGNHDFSVGSDLNPADLTTPILSVSPHDLTANDLNGKDVGTSPVGLILNDEDRLEYNKQLLNSVLIEQDEVFKKLKEQRLNDMFNTWFGK